MLCLCLSRGRSNAIWGQLSAFLLKDFIDQMRDEKMYKKVWSDISVYNTINREEIWRSRHWYTILVHSIVYQWRLLQISSLLMVLYTEISDQTFLYIFSSRIWSIKSFKTLLECESRIVGRSPNFANLDWISAFPQFFSFKSISPVTWVDLLPHSNHCIMIVSSRIEPMLLFAECN